MFLSHVRLNITQPALCKSRKFFPRNLFFRSFAKLLSLESFRLYGMSLLVFNVLPVVLLCLYPCPCFQRCLNRTGLRCQALHIFMDSFQGCYREEPRYCKYFSAVYLLACIGSIASFGLTLSLDTYWIVELFFLIFPAMLVAVVRPYRDSKYNIIFCCSLAVHGWRNHKEASSS